MVSWVLQGFASITFEPLLGLASVVIGSKPELDAYFALPQDLWVTEYFLPMTTSIHQVNLVVALSVLVSSVKRLQSTTPLAEEAFITRLRGHHLLVAVIGTASYAITRGKTRGRSFLVAVYMLAAGIVCAYIGTSKQSYLPARGNALKKITAICTIEHGWPVVEVNMAESPISTAQPRPDEPLDVGSVVAAVFGGFGFGIVYFFFIFLFLFTNFWSILTYPYYVFCRLVDLKPRIR